MIAISVRKAASDAAKEVRANSEAWQELDPSHYNVDAASLAEELRRELGRGWFINVNRAGKVIVHQLQSR